MSSPLRVLLAHTYYRSSAPSGEDAVFDSERALLERSGVRVIPFVRRNDDIDDDSAIARIQLALDTTWSRETYRSLRSLIELERPDVAHFHNTFPQISPSAYAACQRLGVPVVQTLHNYRLVCAGALLQRDGKPCEECLGRSPVLGLLPGLRHRCYRDSVAATGALTLMLAANRINGSYVRNVNRYVALTRFAASRLAAGGLPATRIVVKPNFLNEPPEAGIGRGGYAVYVGRLSHEKGVLTLIEAWRQIQGLRLKIAGHGPLYARLREVAESGGLNIEFLGQLNRVDVLNVVADASVQIVPSEWYEGFPMVLLEALACGTPVIAAKIGSLDEIVQEGVTGTKFPPGNAHDLAAAVRRLIADAEGLARMRQMCRETFERNYRAEQNVSQLLGIYRDVLAETRTLPPAG
jgi:glycosyltransferase involved in cell wall biosynthesis